MITKLQERGGRRREEVGEGGGWGEGEAKKLQYYIGRGVYRDPQNMLRNLWMAPNESESD